MVFNDFMDKLCRLVFLKESVSLPEKYVLGFSTTAPNANGGNITEPGSGTGYARIDLTDLATDGDGIAYNATEIDCGEALADWGTLAWSVLYDGNGNALSAGQMSKPITVDAGETLKLKVGNVKLYFGEAKVNA